MSLRDEPCVYIMLGLSTTSELNCNIPPVPHSFVVTQVTLHTSNLPISFTFESSPHPFLLLTLRACFLNVFQPQNHGIALFLYSTLIRRRATNNTTLRTSPHAEPNVLAGCVVRLPCLPELIWHRHLRPRSASRPLTSRPQVLSVGAKGENTYSHVTR